MRIRFHHKKEWRLLVNVTLVMLVSLLLMELFFVETLEQYISQEALGIIDLCFTMILATDLILWYSEAKDKYNFIRRNWVRIIAVFPFMFVFKAVQLLRIEQMFAFAFSSEIVAEAMVVEKLLRFEKGIKVISKASEVLRGVMEV